MLNLKVSKNLKIFFLGILGGCFFCFFLDFSQKKLEDFFVAQIVKPYQEIQFVNLQAKPKKSRLEINAKAAFSLKINKSGKEKILYKKNENEILPIASLTKLMTALIVLEDPENYNFSEKIKISQKAASQEDVPQDTERPNLMANEIKTVGELLRLTLAFSSNDAAFALSEKIPNFVERMNEKAKLLGLKNTHFVNPTGLEPENLRWSLENKEYFNYSTAQDLISLGKYILFEFPIIFELSNQKNGTLFFKNQKLIGMKTGWAKEAGGCLLLVFSDERENYYLNLILGTKTKEDRFFEMQKLIDWINQ